MKKLFGALALFMMVAVLFVPQMSEAAIAPEECDEHCTYLGEGQCRLTSTDNSVECNSNEGEPECAQCHGWATEGPCGELGPLCA